MARAYNVIDADGHVLEPMDLWEKYIDPAFKTRAPTSDAARFCVTTIPPRDRADGLRTWRRCERLGETMETGVRMSGPPRMCGRPG